MKKNLFFCMIASLIVVAIISLWGNPKSFSIWEQRKLQTTVTVKAEDIMTGTTQKEFETYIQDQFPLKDSVTKISFFLDMMMGKDHVADVYVKNRPLLLEQPKEITEADKKSVYRFLKWLETTKNTYYIPTPSKMFAFKDAYDPTENLQILLNFKEEVSEIGKEHILSFHHLKFQLNSQSYFLSDHHWNGEEAYRFWFWMSTLLHQQDTRYPAPNASDFVKVNVENEFLGNLNRKLVGYFPLERGNVYYRLKHDDNLRVVINGKETTTNAFHQSPMNDVVTYEDLFTENFAELDVFNNNAVTNETLFIIKDSYVHPMVSFFAPYFKHVKVVDSRWYREKRFSSLQVEMKPSFTLILLQDNSYSREMFINF